MERGGFIYIYILLLTAARRLLVLASLITVGRRLGGSVVSR